MRPAEYTPRDSVSSARTRSAGRFGSTERLPAKTYAAFQSARRKTPVYVEEENGSFMLRSYRRAVETRWTKNFLPLCLSLSPSYDRGTVLPTGRTLRDLRVNESKGIEAEKGRKRGRKRAENGRWFTQSSELTRHQKLPKRSSDKWPTYSARMLREAVSNDCLAPLAADLKVHTNKCR